MLTDSKLGMSGAKDAAVEFSKNDNVIYVDQFANVANVKAHELTTALEIISDFKDLDYLIAGVGTSGTITGLSHKLKSHYKDLKVIGIEPNESAILSCGTKGSHGIQGIGAGFIPPLYEKEIVDEIIRVSTNSANEKAKELALQGLFLGISSAAAICGALEICQRVTNKSILVICPDGGQKYMSLGVYNNE